MKDYQKYFFWLYALANSENCAIMTLFLKTAGWPSAVLNLLRDRLRPDFSKSYEEIL